MLLDLTRLEKENMLFKQKINELEKENEKKMYLLEKKIEEDMKMKFNESLQDKHRYESELESKKFYNEVLAK